MRGSCPTALVLCHRLGLKVVESETKILIPPLEQVIIQNEQLVNCLNSFPSLGFFQKPILHIESLILELVHKLRRDR